MKTPNNSAPNDKPKRLADTLPRKRKAFADEILANPKLSGTEAARRTYNTTSDNSAAQIASENLRNPKVLAYLNAHADKAELTVIDAMGAKRSIVAPGVGVIAEEPDHAIRLRAADSILDRVHGKATQNIETRAIIATITMDLSGGTAGEVPPEVLAQLDD